MTYCERKRKHYANPFPNAITTPTERREKYKRLREAGIPPSLAQVGRDWRNTRVESLITQWKNHRKRSKGRKVNPEPKS